MVPAALEDLHEAHVPLGQAPGQEAIGGEGAGNVHVGAVQVEDVLGLARRNVGQLGHRGLHPVGHLVLRDAGVDFRIADGRQFLLVQLGERVEHSPAAGRVDAGGVRQVKHRVARGAERDALVARRQEAGPPQAGENGLRVALGAPSRMQDDERGQVLVQSCPGRTRPRRPCSAGPAAALPVKTKVQAGS